MKKLPLSSVMAEIDGKSQRDYGFPSIVLMENAGLKSWERICRIGLFPPPEESKCLFIAGKGNNGGDAFVMARHCFLSGNRPVIAQTGSELSADSKINRDICRSLGIPLLLWREEENAVRGEIEKADYIFDGIAGTGIRGPLGGIPKELVLALNEYRRGKVVAIDVPSGVGDEFSSGFPAVKADVTVTMGLPKACLYKPAARQYTGRIEVIHLGFPPALIEDPGIPGELLEPADLSAIPPIARDTYKNRRGHLAVFAGNEGTTGAALLAAHAAAVSRAGLVSLYPYPGVYEICAAQTKSVMTKKILDFDKPELFDFSPFQALLFGPGFGTATPREKWLACCAESGLPGVLDADGITIAAEELKRKKQLMLNGRWVLTPHPGEFVRLSGKTKEEILSSPFDAVLELSALLGAVVVLKSHVVIIGSPEGSYRVVDGMNPAMATAGSGDVLSGIIAGLLAGGISPFDAASFGVLMHQEAGKMAAEKRGWFLAEELPNYLSGLTGDYLKVSQ